MSLNDYKLARLSRVAELPFDTLLMAAIAKAGVRDHERLDLVFPKLVAEVHARWHSEDGRLPSDPAGA